MGQTYGLLFLLHKLQFSSICLFVFLKKVYPAAPNSPAGTVGQLKEGLVAVGSRSAEEPDPLDPEIIKVGNNNIGAHVGGSHTYPACIFFSFSYISLRIPICTPLFFFFSFFSSLFKTSVRLLSLNQRLDNHYRYDDISTNYYDDKEEGDHEHLQRILAW
jgi:hypothetical protein